MQHHYLLVYSDSSRYNIHGHNVDLLSVHHSF
jgi:hypothetical protein